MSYKFSPLLDRMTPSRITSCQPSVSISRSELSLLMIRQSSYKYGILPVKSALRPLLQAITKERTVLLLPTTSPIESLSQLFKIGCLKLKSTLVTTSLAFLLAINAISNLNVLFRLKRDRSLQSTTTFAS